MVRKINKHFKWIVFFLLSFIVFEIGFVSSFFVNWPAVASTFQNLKIQKGSVPKAFIVQSGSMEPSIKTGSLVFSIPQKNYRVGEVVTFSPTGGSKNLITHRIVSVAEGCQPGGASCPEGEFVTKGDANEDADTQTVKSDSVIGKTFLTIPYLGYIASFAKNPKGFIILVIVPATIVIYEEIKNLRRELGKHLRKIFQKIAVKISYPRFRKSRRHSERSEESFTNNEILRFAQDDIFPFSGVGVSKTKNVPAIAVAVPVLGVLLVLVAFSASYFSDREKSVNNVLGAAENFGSPTPTTSTTVTPTPTESVTPTPTDTPTGGIVINEVYYDPDLAHIQPGSDENSFEWIELYNSSSQVVNIKNWKVTDAQGTERTITTNDRELSPGQFAVLAKDVSVFNLWTIPSGVEQISLGTTIGNGLSNSGDAVILKDSLGNIVDQMGYGDNKSVFDPSAPDVAEGHSLEREPDGLDTGVASDFVNRTVPSPGS